MIPPFGLDPKARRCLLCAGDGPWDKRTHGHSAKVMTRYTRPSAHDVCRQLTKLPSSAHLTHHHLPKTIEPKSTIHKDSFRYSVRSPAVEIPHSFPKPCKQRIGGVPALRTTVGYVRRPLNVSARPSSDTEMGRLASKQHSKVILMDIVTLRSNDLAGLRASSLPRQTTGSHALLQRCSSQQPLPS